MKAYLKTLYWIFKLQPRRTTVGKHKDSDLCLQNGGVDELHATIEWNESEHCYVLTDLNSVHGTYVNDCRIHNAAVRLTPGDELHFGYGGSAYKLLLETSDPLPVLPAPSTAPPAQARSRARSPSVTPRPPGRPRPASAGAKRSSLGPKASELWGRTHRAGGWTSSTGRRLSPRNISSSQSRLSTQDLIQDKDESWVRRSEEWSGGVMLCEGGEGQGKECVMAALRDEVSALRLQLSQSSQSIQSDPEIRNKLNSLARDIQEKKEEILQLKEQMLQMQKSSGELVAQSVAEREQKIISLREQLANIKSENSRSTALVNSLQKDLVSREKQTLKLAAEVDRLRQDVRYKDAQLSNMANKFSQMKASEKLQEDFLAREKELESLKKALERLEETLREKQKELKQLNTERDSLRHKLQQRSQEQTSLYSEMSRMKLLQQQTLQREEKAQTELRHSQTQLLNFCSQISKCILLTSETVSEQEMLERLSELAEQKEEFRIRVQELEQKLQECTENQKLVEEDTEKLKARLTEWQSHIQKDCTVDSIQSQISVLQHVKVCPAVSWIQTHTLLVLSSLLTHLQDTTNRLQAAAGVEVSEKTGGVPGAIQALCQKHQEIQAELRSLKAEKQQLEEREALAGDLQAMRQELQHQQLQVAERHAEMENSVILHMEKMKTDLESSRTAEAALQLQMETQEMEWCNKLKEAEKRERELMKRLNERQQQEEHWRERIKAVEEREEEWGKRVQEALQRGAEEERERIRVEIEEYRDQVRQHAFTIVAMEKQVLSAQQRETEVQEERESLMQQLTEALGRLEVDERKPSVSSEPSKELQQLEQTVTSLRASLEASQQEVIKQGEVITSLSRDLAHAHARLSDLTGELSEQQKMELETHRALVVDQRMQLSTLTQKLTMTSQLLEQREQELKALREKQRHMKADLKNKAEGQEDINLIPLLTDQHTKDVAVMVNPSHMTTQGSVGRGHRHEEMLHQQKKTLSEMRARIRSVEHKCSNKLLGQQGEPVKQGQMKSQKLQRPAVRRGSISSVSGFAFPEALSEAARERTARLDMSDTLELSERSYVDLARALCEALELSEGQLSGCVPMKHVPPAERTRLASLRQDDLELFRTRLALQNSQSQKTHLLLQQSQAEIHTLRESLTGSQELQTELDSVRAELKGGKQENDALRQALQLIQTQLQHQQDQHCPKTRKALNVERMEGRSARIGHHNCVPNDNYDKVAVPKRRQQQQQQRERRRRRESEVDVVKSEPGQKEEAACKVLTQPVIVLQQQPPPTMELTEAH
ncbi:forkhead-associated domain-containing protein 1 isoform X1 [Astyanax mexicanus]|uniref:forkhead-associated domain-containing protein 1 isoform X1 n=1 Tax=Astyanax mexicanus TaxID=7994 RepID=UPI0020CB39CC|nr:forkhead-associated domain-containing protein 1 isoform X1 [Astyanax mexicanus]XP_049342098.1 forkhead-associated domain-containing protein 1 isoform X1 [Astyanax mexicanus]